MRRAISISVMVAFNCAALFAQTTNPLAPGAPGQDAHWTSAAKQGFGTANSTASKVWFTLADGVLTEVYYPTLDMPNVQTLQLIIVTPEGKVETESEDTTHWMRKDDARSLSFEQENRAKNDVYVIYKKYTTDPDRNTLLMDVSFRAWKQGSSAYDLYVYYDPSLNNSGMHDSAWTQNDAILAQDADKASALVANPPFALKINGYLGKSDGLTQLRNRTTVADYQRAPEGNVTQVAKVGRRRIPSGAWVTFTLALGFGKDADEALQNARTSLARGYETTSREYEAGWHQYVATLPTVESKYQRQVNIAAMVLKALEDKTHPGAFIASPSIPWGGGPNANEPTISGYHAVWARDLYQVATALEAIGDHAAANRALDYLFNVQQKADGSFPQNTWVDGRPIGDGLQMDQIAFPSILAYQLSRTDRATWLKHIKPAADFIIHHGPVTGQDRWEEQPGYSPATIAAEIAGLVCAASIAKANGDNVSGSAYLKTADDWAGNVERWTATTTGKYGDGNYYLRISENENPNDGAKIEINSGGGVFDEREIVDAGFLELVRLGIKSAEDPLVVKSLAVVDKVIRLDTRVGAAWYRYNHDAYGERPDGGPYDGRNGKGRLWALLTGERGEYELARGQSVLAGTRLRAMMSFANDGMMLPEQIWDREDVHDSQFRWGLGTGSATPLAWSMAQFIRLAMNIKGGRNLETPRVVAARYLNRSRKQ
jgi:glucoamylase